MARITANEADALGQALLAAGRDKDDPGIWDVWVARGLAAALDELRKETNQ